MKILWISYYFYPFSGVGPNKNIYLVEELSKNNEILVLSTTPNKFNTNLDTLYKSNKKYNIIKIPSIDNQIFFSKILQLVKNTFYKDINKNINFNTKNNHYSLIKSLLSFIDYQNSWYFMWKIYKFFILKKIKKFQPDVIYVSAPPFSGMLIAKEIKEIINVPLVVEYRDLWTGSHHYKKNKYIKNLEYKIEKEILKSVDKLLFATEGIGKKHYKIFKKEYEILYNFFPYNQVNCPFIDSKLKIN